MTDTPLDHHPDLRRAEDHPSDAQRRAQLGTLEPPAAGGTTDVPDRDERRMRRSVRRTVLRTAWHAALLVIAGAIVLQLVGFYLVQPVLVARGDRVADSVAATIDVPVMTIPGAEMAEIRSNPGVLRRTNEVRFERFVGSRPTELGWLTTRLGPVGLSTPHTASLADSWLHGLDGSLAGPDDRSPVPFEPDRLADGSAVTVLLRWQDPIDPAQAQAVAGSSEALALLWAGFEVPGRAEAFPEGTLGYSACGTIPASLRDRASPMGGFGGGGGFRDREVAGSGVDHALEELRRATANLAASGWLDGATAPGSLEDLEGTAEALASGDPRVTSLVVTGSLDVVADAAAAAGATDADLLEVDFDRGPPESCG
jgi:hypothetical protein